jgi:hypothetical protein
MTTNYDLNARYISCKFTSTGGLSFFKANIVFVYFLAYSKLNPNNPFSRTTTKQDKNERVKIKEREIEKQI